MNSENILKMIFGKQSFIAHQSSGAFNADHSRALFGTLTLVLSGFASVSTPTFAQSDTPPAVQTPAGQCPSTDIPDSAALNDLRELALKPGVKINPLSLMKNPQTAQLIGEMMQREESRKKTDWSGLCRYRAENISLQSKETPQVVFLGDSITENWIHADAKMFSDEIVNRGISGQTSSQILLRFYPDVVALHPKVVHIMAGTNDILQNIGPVGDADVINNIRAMIDIAQANQIKVVLASILPISVRAWQPDLKPGPRLIKLNEQLKTLATERKILFMDYFSSLKDISDSLNADLGNDGVHPNRAGYAVMKPMAIQAIERALQ